MSDDSGSRPPGATEFEAVYIPPRGWLVLTPWVQSPDGHWYRGHIEQHGGPDSEEWARHLASEINAAMAKIHPRFRAAFRDLEREVEELRRKVRPDAEGPAGGDEPD